jgi:hypothetical protein
MNFNKIERITSKRKYLSFISLVRNENVRLIRNIAFLSVKQISSVLDDVVIKVTINDDHTISLEQTEGTYCELDQIERVFRTIDEYDYVVYGQKYIVNDLSFKDEDNRLCYLEVEYQKPIDRFRSLLNDFEAEKEQAILSVENVIKKSNKDYSTLIDSIFDFEEDINLLDEKEEEEVYDKLVKSKEAEPSYLVSLFKESIEAQKKELMDRIDQKEKDLIREKNDMSRLNSKIVKIDEDIVLLKSRLNSMVESDLEFNGFYFAISEQLNTPIDIEESHKYLLKAISNNLGIKESKLITLITQPSYKIFLKKSNEDLKYEDIYKKIYLVDTDGLFELLKENIIIYKGDLTWHKLVDIMIKKGFEQNSDFDKELDKLLKNELIEESE